MLENILSEIILIFLTAAAAYGPSIEIVVSLLKRFLPYSGAAMTVIVSVIFVILASTAQHFGYLNQFDNFLDIVVKLVTLFVGSLLGSTSIYQVAQKLGTPIVGYKRS